MPSRVSRASRDSQLAPASARGFSLVEILLSLLILSGTVVALLGGMSASEQLESRARFEDQAGAFAERELELLKSDLLAGRRPPGPRGNVGRFRMPGGWKSQVVWTAPDAEGVVRLVSEISRQNESIRIESFLYIPAGMGLPDLPALPRGRG